MASRNKGVWLLVLLRIAGSNLEMNAYVNMFHKYCNLKKTPIFREICSISSCDLF